MQTTPQLKSKPSSRVCVSFWGSLCPDHTASALNSRQPRCLRTQTQPLWRQSQMIHGFPQHRQIPEWKPEEFENSKSNLPCKLWWRRTYQDKKTFEVCSFNLNLKSFNLCFPDLHCTLLQEPTNVRSSP